VFDHSIRISDKTDTWQCRAYHAGQNYYVEVDIVMDEELPLKVTHDVSQTLQRKLEGEWILLPDMELEYLL
jgi:divalent metal cation (Fe/Co/Zn/Cd) transporter